MYNNKCQEPLSLEIFICLPVGSNDMIWLNVLTLSNIMFKNLKHFLNCQTWNIIQSIDIPRLKC